MKGPFPFQSSLLDQRWSLEVLHGLILNFLFLLWGPSGRVVVWAMTSGPDHRLWEGKVLLERKLRDCAACVALVANV